MTKQLDTGEDKIQQICDLLRHETIDPAKSEAAEIVENAKREAERIISAAETQAKELIQESHQKIEKERAVFRSALSQASAQCFEALKQRIQDKLFNSELEAAIKQSASSPDVVANLIEAIIKGIEKDGISSDLSALVPESVSPEEVNQYLGEKILKKLSEKGVGLGSFAAGAEVKLKDKKVMLDISDQVLKELLANYMRKDFREFIFQA